MYCIVINLQTVFSPPPANHFCKLSNKGLLVLWQAHWNDVLLEDHVPGQSDQGQVIPEVGWIVAWVDLE